MGKIAFVFSGQGAQYSGMGKSLAETSPAAAEVFAVADSIRPGTSEQCFSADISQLTVTSNTQPCMFAVELAAAAALTSAGVRADMAAGFSLGEISALSFSGAATLQDGFRLVMARGALMQRDAEAAPAGMAAVLKLDAETVERLCSAYNRIYPVNYNCPGQIAVAGAAEELTPFCADVKTAGGRAVPLKVAGAFHSPFMARAAADFGLEVQKYTLREPDIPLYSNCTALPHTAKNFAEMLSRQICSPVRWQSIVENMVAEGVDTFIECGPGKTLCGLIKKTAPGVRTFNVEDEASLQNTIEGVRGC